MISRLGNWVANRIIARAQRTPYEHLRDYMDRFWLFRIWRYSGSHYALICARVHHIKRSDDDRHCHCHPWPYLSVILKGGYWEVREYPIEPVERFTKAALAVFKAGPGKCALRQVGDKWVLDAKTWHGPGSILFRRSTDRHRLVLPDAGEAMSIGCWTLFMTFGQAKRWFFHTEAGPIWWKEYDAWRAANRPDIAPLAARVTHG